MLVKCETKSNRVKGLSFHSKLSWILASLHNGVVQLWDFRIGSLIERYEEHEGPVRGVDFHQSQPIFVTGGDDYRIKVWNYRQRRCLFTLLGHLDYIRTVQFHPEYPWILSSSDDQTVRIWNWQNRKCIAVLAGHSHYVMCAQFHPSQDLLVSASLDQTIRVWDISGLRDRSVSLRTPPSAGHGRWSGEGNFGAGGEQGSGGRGSISNFMGLHAHGQAIDMFGSSDAVCKFILEGHDRGVNWAAFHPKMPLIVSGADDRLVKLWRFSENKWWEVESFRGHFNNVSCVLFHPTRDLLLSNSEDRTIRVWDISKRILLHTFRRENDRFWILDALRNSNILAVGHDSGMVVFKLDRERPASQCLDNNIYFVKDRWVCCYETRSGTAATSLVACRRPANALSSEPVGLSVNPLSISELAMLIFYKDGADTGSYDLVVCPSGASSIPGSTPISTAQGVGSSVAFVARNRFAVLEASGSIAIYNLSNELSRRFDPPVSVGGLFYGGNGRLLLRSGEMVYLYDLTSRKNVAEINCPGGARYATFSEDGQYLALVCKHHVVLTTPKLEFLHSVHENIRVKGGAWDPVGAFVYSTLSHVKYCLPNRDSGILLCLMQPLYILKVSNQKLWVIDRTNPTLRVMNVNCVEYLFKLALQNREFDQVALHIRNGRICGNNVVNYLRLKGFPEVALQFVDDVKTRFHLSLEDGNLDEALASALRIDEEAYWDRLAVEAMRQGQFQAVELAYQKTKNMSALSFLYLISGNHQKLRKLLRIAEGREDLNALYSNAMYLGDNKKRLEALCSSGQTPLASLLMRVQGLDSGEHSYLKDSVEGLDLDSFLAEFPKRRVLQPPIPYGVPPDELASLADKTRLTSWPRTQSSGSKFEHAMMAASSLSPEVAQLKLAATLSHAGAAAEKKVQLITQRQRGAAITTQVGTGLLASGAGDDDAETLDNCLENSSEVTAWNEDFDLELKDLAFKSEDRLTPAETTTSNTIERYRITAGEVPQKYWGQSSLSLHPYDLVLCDRVSEALEMLSKRIGLVNAEPLEPVLKAIVCCSSAVLPMLPFLAPKRLPLLASGSVSEPSIATPMLYVNVNMLLGIFKEANRLMFAGNLAKALVGYRKLLAHLALGKATTQADEEKMVELLSWGRVFALAMQIECKRQELADTDPRRSVELAAYLGCSQLLPGQSFLVTRRALTVTWKAKNYITAAAFGRKILSMQSTNIKGFDEGLAMARKVVPICDSKATDQYDIDFDPSEIDSLVVCAASLTRIKSTDAIVKCPFCGASAKTIYSGRLCQLCQISQLGARVLGLQFRPLGLRTPLEAAG